VILAPSVGTLRVAYHRDGPLSSEEISQSWVPERSSLSSAPSVAGRAGSLLTTVVYQPALRWHMAMQAAHPSDGSLRDLLLGCRTIAVVGLSGDTHRPSHEVAVYLQRQGYRILPVNPKLAGQVVLGELCVAALADLQDTVDIVDVFRRSEDVGPVAQAAVAIGARCMWQQLGVANRQADDLAKSAGLISVIDRCLKVEHARILG